MFKERPTNWFLWLLDRLQHLTLWTWRDDNGMWHEITVAIGRESSRHGQVYLFSMDHVWLEPIDFIAGHYEVVYASQICAFGRDCSPQVYDPEVM